MLVVEPVGAKAATTATAATAATTATTAPKACMFPSCMRSAYRRRWDRSSTTPNAVGYWRCQPPRLAPGAHFIETLLCHVRSAIVNMRPRIGAVRYETAQRPGWVASSPPLRRSTRRRVAYKVKHTLPVSTSMALPRGLSLSSRSLCRAGKVCPWPPFQEQAIHGKAAAALRTESPRRLEPAWS